MGSYQGCIMPITKSPIFLTYTTLLYEFRYRTEDSYDFVHQKQEKKELLINEQQITQIYISI